jgi:hypothetical protein
MALSKRSTLALCGITAGTALLVALGTTVALAGSSTAAAGGTGTCSATAHVDNHWGTGADAGAIVTVTVANTAPTPATKWSATWSLGSGERIVSAWNATVTTVGTTATAVNASYNGSLAPGASTTFGMQLWGTSSAPVLSCSNDAVMPSSSSSGSTADFMLTLADDGRSFTMFVGQTVRVDLRSDFRQPRLSGSELSPVNVSGGYPTGQPMSALYRAVTPGSVTVSTQTDNACNYTTPPCGAPVQGWSVHITVITPPSNGRTVTIGRADNLSSITLETGDTLVVNLPSDYQPPTIAPGGILVQQDATGGYPTNQPFVGHYAAVNTGQVDLSSITDSACIHGPSPCPTPRTTWKVHVTVMLFSTPTP